MPHTNTSKSGVKLSLKWRSKKYSVATYYVLDENMKTIPFCEMLKYSSKVLIIIDKDIQTQIRQAVFDFEE